MSRTLSPVRRAARLLRLLRQPITREALQLELGCSPAQLWRDLRDIAEEGWTVHGQGGGPQQAKSLWRDAEPNDPDAEPKT